MRQALEAARRRGVPIVAVSGIVGGRALKGPADRMLVSLGHESSALGVARLYAELLDGFVLDTLDAALVPAIEALGIRDHRHRHGHDRRRQPRARLARETLEFAGRLGSGGAASGRSGSSV